MNAKLRLMGRAGVVGALSLTEKVRRPVPCTSDDVPISGAHVTTRWLTAVLCRDTPGARCEPDDRKAWQDDLLTSYLEALHAAGGPRIPLSEALLTYRQHAFWPYTAWAFTIGRAFYQPKMQPVETCRTLVRRTATAIHELDAFDAVGV